MGLFLRKYHLLRCWGLLSLRKWIGALTLSLLLKLPPRKLEPDLFYEVDLYLYKSTWSCMEYSCHVWADTPSCYLELLYKLQKRICRTVGSSLPACLEPLAHGRCSSKLALLASSEGCLLIVLKDYMICYHS